jgi:hypothetical protein
VRRLDSVVWSRLTVHDPRLLRVGSLKELEAAVEASIKHPREAFNPGLVKDIDPYLRLPVLRPGYGVLASAVCEAFYTGISEAGILNAIRAAQQDLPAERRLDARTIARVLWDFRSLIMRYNLVGDAVPTPDEQRQLAAFAQLTWVRCLAGIIDDALLGEDFVDAFRSAIAETSRDMSETYRLIADAFPEKSRWPGPRRANRALERWQNVLYREAQGLDRRFLPCAVAGSDSVTDRLPGRDQRPAALEARTGPLALGAGGERWHGPKHGGLGKSRPASERRPAGPRPGDEHDLRNDWT